MQLTVSHRQIQEVQKVVLCILVNTSQLIINGLSRNNYNWNAISSE